MKHLLLFIFLFFARFCFAQQDSLVWSDEFSGTGAPDPTKWGYDLGNSGWGNNEIQNYTNSTQNSYQDTGYLHIKAIKYYNGWSSARLLTHNKYDFKYGRVVFRAKIPVGSGTWPALWMLGSNIYTNGWPACGEMDVMEEVGKDPCAMHSTIHTPSSYGNSVNTKMKMLPTCSSDFHTYQLRWSPEKLEFSIDSVLFYTYNPTTKNNSTWPFDKTCFIIMNVAIGGNMGSDPQYETGGLKNGVDPSLTSATMMLDFVRIYQWKINSIGENDNKPVDRLGNAMIVPNPTNGFTQLQIAAGPPVKATLFNVTGQLLHSSLITSENTTFDFSNLMKGIYYLSLQSDEKMVSRKIILY